PEVAVVVRQDPCGIVVKESGFPGVSNDADVAQRKPRESRNPAAKPQVAAPVIENRSDRKIDLLLPGLIRRLSPGKSEEPEHGSEPHGSGRIAIDRKRVIAGLAEGRRLAGDSEWPHLAVADPEHQRFRGGYHQALVVLIDGGYEELEPFTARVGGEPAVFVADQSVAT